MISLCMIVRDEAELLPEFLERARGAYDELVAVDTGSTDETPRLLRAAGADVLHRPWDDDFSAARNCGLARARGDLVLVLDADEMASPELSRELRALEKDPRAGAATVRMVNPLPHGLRRDADLLRVFRPDPSIRFRFPIHEEIATSVEAHLARTGLELRRLQSSVHHRGYVRARAAAKDKRARDERLLEACVAQDPSDLYSWFKLLELARFWSDHRRWGELARRAAPALDRASAKALGRARFGGELVALVAQGLFPPGTAEGLAFLQRFAPAVPESAALHLALGEALERRGDLTGAHAEFQRCLAFADSPGDRQLATARPQLALARLALIQGEMEAAWAHVQEALLSSPADPEALLAAAALARQRGGAGELARFAGEHRRANPESGRDLAQALGEEALLCGDAHRAALHLREAAGNPPSGPAAVKLAQALLAAGNLGAARALAASLADHLPQAALGVLACDLAEGRNSDLLIELEPEEAWLALAGWIEVLWRSGPRDVKERFALHAAAIHELFPRLPALLARLAAGAPAVRRAS